MSTTSAAAPASDALPPPPASAAKAASNRANARKSTGPRTPAGKARARYNAFKHGLCARTVSPCHENVAEYVAMRDSCRRFYRPGTAHERTLCDRIALNLWRQDRAARAEVGLLAGPDYAPPDDASTGGEAAAAPAPETATATATEDDAEAAPDDSVPGVLDPDDPLAQALARAFVAGFGPGGIVLLARYEAHITLELTRTVRLLETLLGQRSNGEIFSPMALPPGAFRVAGGAWDGFTGFARHLVDTPAPADLGPEPPEPLEPADPPRTAPPPAEPPPGEPDESAHETRPLNRHERRRLARAERRAARRRAPAR